MEIFVKILSLCLMTQMRMKLWGRFYFHILSFSKDLPIDSWRIEVSKWLFLLVNFFYWFLQVLCDMHWLAARFPSHKFLWFIERFNFRKFFPRWFYEAWNKYKFLKLSCIKTRGSLKTYSWFFLLINRENDVHGGRL